VKGLDLRPLAPAVIIAVTGLVVLLAQAFTPRGKSAPSAPLSVAGLLAALTAVGIMAGGRGRGAVLAGTVCRGCRAADGSMPVQVS
jgi:NADH:ubiquinone oxidoreductase subunit 2 (subunit N)